MIARPSAPAPSCAAAALRAELDAANARVAELEGVVARLLRELGHDPYAVVSAPGGEVPA